MVYVTVIEPTGWIELWGTPAFQGQATLEGEWEVELWIEKKS